MPKQSGKIMEMNMAYKDKIVDMRNELRVMN